MKTRLPVPTPLNHILVCNGALKIIIGQRSYGFAKALGSRHKRDRRGAGLDCAEDEVNQGAGNFVDNRRIRF